jgi:hypothetical protein
MALHRKRIGAALCRNQNPYLKGIGAMPLALPADRKTLQSPRMPLTTINRLWYHMVCGKRLERAWARVCQKYVEANEESLRGKDESAACSRY